MTTALLIIDTQKGMFGIPDFHPHAARDTLAAIESLLARARQAGAPVVFVKHDGPDGPLALGTPMHEICDEIAPRAGEPVITKTRCGAFDGTPLLAKLRDLGAKTLVVCGLQTDFCVDTAIRTAADHGFEIIVARGAHSTFDSPALKAADIIAHHEHVWARQFAAVVPWAEVSFG
jgi:nicotinamidase-related amidase